MIEIISDSETQRILEEKLADYQEIGVDECWVIRPDLQNMEVLRLTQTAIQSAALYQEAEAVASVTFPGLPVFLADIFAP